MQKGGVFNEGSLISDVGPSSLVVVATIANGLYPLSSHALRTTKSFAIDGARRIVTFLYDLGSIEIVVQFTILGF